MAAAKGELAATEFQKILDHRGANWGPLYPLSDVGGGARDGAGEGTSQSRAELMRTSSRCGKTQTRTCQF